MPRNMMCELPPKCQFGNFGKSSSQLESGKGRPRRRSSTLEDDETLRYLSHEEKDVLIFFEETIDALEDDLEEQGLRRHSPKSMQEIASSHSEPEDIIDLVRPVAKNNSQGLDHSRHKEAVLPSAPPLPIYEGYPASVPVQHPKLLRSVPTPLVIAQKISKNQGETSSFSPASPKEKISADRRTPSSSPKCNGGRFVVVKPSVPPPTPPKPQKFPSNISITNLSEKDFCRTITRAAVNVQERKAQVLANVNGSAFLISELEERLQKHEFSSPTRSISVKDLSSEQTRHEALSKLGLAQETLVQAESEPAKSPSVPTPKDERPREVPALSNGYRNIHDILKRDSGPFPSTNKTVTFKPDTALAEGKLARQNTSKSFTNHRQPDIALEIRKRSGSLPRASGLRPQGVTVQFSGRGSSEEARREALRKLGLLKE